LNYLKYLFYGIIQGFTEFLPISSSAHLKVLSELFNLQDPGSSLSAIVQIASIFALLIYFRKDLKTVNGNSFLNLYFYKNKIFISILIGSISIIFLGGFIKFIIPQFYESYLRSNVLIGVISIMTALLMYLSQLTKNKDISLANHSYLNSFFIGIGQAFAIIPGVSRSGITITIALLLGWKRVDAAKFSFLLGIPAISLAAFVEILSSIKGNLFISYGPLVVALISAFITSYISIKFLIRYISMKGLKIFIYYKLFFGLIILFWEFSK
tara:strand:- start:804 stop:1607 length:804 start_codon:yes stop_codon:yes gene_type:complete